MKSAAARIAEYRDNAKLCALLANLSEGACLGILEDLFEGLDSAEWSRQAQNWEAQASVLERQGDAVDLRPFHAYAWPDDMGL